MIEKKIFKNEDDGSFGYEIWKDNKKTIYQPFKPKVQGFNRMTEQEAINEAEKDIIEISKPTPKQTIIEIFNLSDKDEKDIIKLIENKGKKKDKDFLVFKY